MGIDTAAPLVRAAKDKYRGGPWTHSYRCKQKKRLKGSRLRRCVGFVLVGGGSVGVSGGPVSTASAEFEVCATMFAKAAFFGTGEA